MNNSNLKKKWKKMQISDSPPIVIDGQNQYEMFILYRGIKIFNSVLRYSQIYYLKKQENNPKQS